MIFVTVGTHEQPFNRLIQKIDELKKDGTIQDDVIIQTGFSTYEPKYCQWSKLIPYQQMVKNVADARIVITHGGPASFIMPLQIGKTPIVVPRQHQFNEHVNDHQVEFARNVAQRMGTIIPVSKNVRLHSLNGEKCVNPILRKIHVEKQLIKYIKEEQIDVMIRKLRPASAPAFRSARARSGSHRPLPRWYPRSGGSSTRRSAPPPLTHNRR